MRVRHMILLDQYPCRGFPHILFGGTKVGCCHSVDGSSLILSPITGGSLKC